MKKKSFVVSLSCAAGIFLLVITLALLAPVFIGQKIVKEKIIQELSRQLNADVRVDRVALTILPRPRAIAHKLTLAFTNGDTVSITKASLFPAILPLFAGDIKPSRISIESPNISFSLPQEKKTAPETKEDYTIAGMQKRAADVLKPLLQKVPPSSLMIEGGTMHINTADATLFSFSDISANMDFSAGRASIGVACSSNIWKKIAIQAAAGINALKLDGTVSVSQLDPQPIIKYVSPGTFDIGKSAIDGEGSFSSDGAGTLRASLNVSIPYLTLNEQDRQQVIKGEFQKIELEADARNTTVAVDVAFDYPRLNVSGNGTIDNAYRNITIEAEGKDIDLISLEDVVLFFSGKQPLLRDIADHVEGGTVADISFKAQGPLGADLIENKDFSLHGSIANGRILIPEAELDVQEVSAAVTAQGGLLEAKDLKARYENNRIQNGTVQLDLAQHFKPLLVDTEFTCDLSYLPRFIHFIPEPDTRDELSLIKSPQGTGSGRFTLTDVKGSYKTEVSISSLNLQADYRTFPVPFKLRSGKCIYANDMLTFNEVSGMLGRTVISDTAASFGLGDDRSFKITSSGSTIFLDELRMVLNSFPEIQGVIKDIREATGSVAINSLHINGPLRSPEQWKFMLQGDVRDVKLGVAQLDGPATVKKAAIKIDQDIFSLSGARANYLDSTLEGSVTLNGYLQGIDKVTVTARGSLGQKSMLRIMDTIKAPAEIMPRTPLSIAQSQVTWSRGGSTKFSGDFSSTQGPRVFLDVQADSQALEIKKLKISDRDSESMLSLGIREDLVDISFKGALKKTTLDRLLVNNELVQGWIKGDMTAHLDQKYPQQSTASGTLAWEDVQPPNFREHPVNIKSASVTAQGNTFLVEDAQVAVGVSKATAKGSIGLAQEGYVLDLQLASENLNFDELNARTTRDSGDGGAEEFWETPLRGKLFLSADALSLKPLQWNPFNAEVTFADRKITVAIVNSKLCAIETPGTIVVTPEKIMLNAQPAANKASAKEVIQCLSGERAIITGRFDLQSDLAAQGSADDLINNMKGNISVAARKGRIYRSNILTKILSFLSLRNLVTGGTSDITKKGFAYRSIDIKGEVQGDIFTMREGVLDSNTLSVAWEGTYNMKNSKLDITMLATPFQVYDLLLMSIPVVGIVFGRTLIGVPIHLTGTLDEPKLGPGNPVIAAKGLFGIVKNIVKLPIKIIEPIIPQTESEKE